MVKHYGVLGLQKKFSVANPAQNKTPNLTHKVLKKNKEKVKKPQKEEEKKFVNNS